MSESANQPDATPNDRDPKGRFAAGNKGGPGTSSTRRQKARQRAMKYLLDGLMKDDGERLRSIMDGLISDAKESQSARKFLLEILIGRNTDTQAIAAIERIQQQVAKLAAKGAKS